MIRVWCKECAELVAISDKAELGGRVPIKCPNCGRVLDSGSRTEKKEWMVR